ncbi:MAG: transglycosylase SLT domain-containing protein [Deltaproteobacteria bacterium]|nr:transglycosylase SLT domain-containing protein [Deltaproteobacteria bacterium]
MTVSLPKTTRAPRRPALLRRQVRRLLWWLTIGALTSTPALAAGLGADDPLAAARAALAAGRHVEARALLDRAGVDAPGLRGAALDGVGDHAGACALYQADRGSPRGAAAALRSARCLEAGDPGRALAAWLEVGAGPLGDDARVVDGFAAFLERRALPVPEGLRVFDVEVGLFDDEEREALGRALLVVAMRDTPTRAARALERLLVELSDTEAAATAAALPAAKARPPEDLAAAVKRADQLAQRHQSEAVVAALSRFSLDDGATACEARLLLGKAWRKLRKYRAAQQQLDAVAKRCTDDTKKKAAYLAARVAAVSNNARAPTLLREFARTWPDDPLTDDTVLWLGDLLARQGDDDAAAAALGDLLARFPNGDMAHEARFALALVRARKGDVEAARALLDEAARTAQGSSPAGSPYQVDRALYWSARLQLAPRLDRLDATADPRSRDAALAALTALAQSRPASFYGHLARLLVVDVATKAKLAPPALPSVRLLRAVAATGSVTPSARLAADPRFLLARALVEGGYDDEALLALDRVDLAAATPEDRFALALLVARVGAPGQGHALLRNGGLALLSGMPGRDNALAWSLDWPRAYAAAIEPAADEAQVPRPLLFGLAREESAFDADVVSWAGAVGLCQLMPPTANDEARDLKLPAPTIAALTEPTLNARLGAAHLSRRLKGLRHPLLAIAAYNAGPGAVLQWLPPRGVRMPLDLFVEQIPVEETRNYVKKVTGSWVSYSALDGDVEEVRFALEVGR